MSATAATASAELHWIREQLSRPGTDPASADRRAADRTTLRRKLGIDDAMLALVPVVAEVAALDPMRAVFLAGVVEKLDQPVALALPRTVRGLDKARKLQKEAGLRFPLVIVDPPLAAVWPAMDVAFEIDQSLAPYDGTDADGLLAAWADRCGTALRRSIRRPVPAGAPVPPVASTLWWAADLPAALRGTP